MKGCQFYLGHLSVLSEMNLVALTEEDGFDQFHIGWIILYDKDCFTTHCLPPSCCTYFPEEMTRPRPGIHTTELYLSLLPCGYRPIPFVGRIYMSKDGVQCLLYFTDLDWLR